MGAKQRWDFVACMGWGMASGKLVCSTGEGRSGDNRPKSLVMLPLMASPLQGLIADMEWGRVMTSLKYLLIGKAFLHTLSPPQKTFWKTEQKQWGKPKGWWESHSPCHPDHPVPLSQWAPKGQSCQVSLLPRQSNLHWLTCPLSFPWS